MSDRPLLADELPVPAGEEIKPLGRVYARMKSESISPYDGSRRVRTGGTKIIQIRVDAKDYVRLKNAVDSTPEMTMQGFCEQAILNALEKIEKEHGGPFSPSRTKRPMQRSPSRHIIDIYV